VELYNQYNPKYGDERLKLIVEWKSYRLIWLFVWQKNWLIKKNFIWICDFVWRTSAKAKLEIKWEQVQKLSKKFSDIKEASNFGSEWFNGHTKLTIYQ